MPRELLVLHCIRNRLSALKAHTCSGTHVLARPRQEKTQVDPGGFAKLAPNNVLEKVIEVDGVDDAANAVTSGKDDMGKALFCATVHGFGDWTSRNR